MRPASLTIARGSWLLTGTGDLPEDGAVVLSRDRIAAVGRFEDLAAQFPAGVVREYPGAVLMPPLVNCHTHLELSYLGPADNSRKPQSFPDWIQELLASRAAHPASPEEIIERAVNMLQGMHGQGVAAVADIGNLDFIRTIGDGFPGIYLFFHEYLGLHPDRAADALAALAKEDPALAATGHAPYSTSRELLIALKQRAVRHNRLFPIHVAETADEIEFMRAGSGPMRRFLEQRGAYHDSFTPVGIDNGGSLQYLEQLGILDDQTLCVHCVHVTDQEIESLAVRGAQICLCPGSNRYLGQGPAPVDRFLKRGLLPGLGTDSLASNPVLSLWNEMRIIREEFSAIPAASIVAMATLGGARALGIESELGTLAPSKTGRLLAVPLPGKFASSEAVLEFLVRGGEEITPSWVEHDL